MQVYKYKVDFYCDENGVSQINNFIDALWKNSHTSKDARIQYEQVLYQLKLLRLNGTNLSQNITKHIDEDIWELRPGHNRILYFCWLEDTFIMLHQFRKTTEKTPKREIKRAKAERDDYIRRCKH